MKIIINGHTATTTETNLKDLLLGLESGSETVATAVNGIFVAIADRASYQLSEGESIEIVTPMQGG